ncbi:unnamed protein product [Caenorhabditis auriculariae]|uniref:Uncharacterized protein n=1 Tax=Caenorhabditis auriculariae TaxID=2777116 RepID=A0A8S1HVQ8_9PELO|nr:unnamed protein product [Caenorhabditis auriculariae]
MKLWLALLVAFALVTPSDAFLGAIFTAVSALASPVLNLFGVGSRPSPSPDPPSAPSPPGPPGPPGPQGSAPTQRSASFQFNSHGLFAIILADIIRAALF